MILNASIIGVVEPIRIRQRFATVVVNAWHMFAFRHFGNREVAITAIVTGLM
jgi:hypothetical protein